MSRWRDFVHRYVATPVDVRNTVLTPDVVPTRDEARRRFLAESAKPRDERDMAEIDRCLAAVSEHPDRPVGIRYATPGGAS
jgi:hypothetical protein